MQEMAVSIPKTGRTDRDPSLMRFRADLIPAQRDFGQRAVIEVMLYYGCPYAAVFMDGVRLPVANTRLKRELVWQPAFPTFRSVLSRLAATGWLPTRAQ
jgi:hypothetical protein